MGEMAPVLDRLRGGLIVSCQPVDDGPMDRVDIIVAMAMAAVAGGAVGLRIEGSDNLAAVRKAVSVPLIGIIKRDFDESPVRITALLEDVDALVGAGADIIAYDATSRLRPVPAKTICERIRSQDALAMADCSTAGDGRQAITQGAQILGSTLSGYTEETQDRGDEPDFQLIRELAAIGGFVMAEGRINTPALAEEAIRAGAAAVTVGSAITRIEHIAGWYRSAVKTGWQARAELS